MNAVAAAVWSELDIFTFQEIAKLAVEHFLSTALFHWTSNQLFISTKYDLSALNTTGCMAPWHVLRLRSTAFYVLIKKWLSWMNPKDLKRATGLVYEVGINISKLNVIGGILVKVSGRVLPCHCTLSPRTLEHFQRWKKHVFLTAKTCNLHTLWHIQFSFLTFFFFFLNGAEFTWSFKWLAEM